jgi:ion channel-forming bestrophin family protein
MERGVVTEIGRSSTLRKVAFYAVGVAAYSLIAVFVKNSEEFGNHIALPSDLHAAFTLVLGWLLVFRTNSSYARWWEARQLWGALVNVSRNMAIKVADLCKAGDGELNKFRIEIVAFAYGLKDHLRNESQLQKLDGFEACNDHPSHVPSYLITRMYEEIGSWKSDGFIDGDDLIVLDAEARQFLDICGGCERIRNTRVVRSYRTFARQCVGLYLITFPWGVVDSCRWWTVPLTAIVAYFMLGLETVAEHVEEPFGYDEDDLDLDGLCKTIAITVQEVFDRRLARGDAASVNDTLTRG